MLGSFDFKEAAAAAFNPCHVSGCTKRSPGIRCSVCGLATCAGHAYWRLSLDQRKATPVCAACVVASHLDLVPEEPEDEDEDEA